MTARIVGESRAPVSGDWQTACCLARGKNKSGITQKLAERDRYIQQVGVGMRDVIVKRHDLVRFVRDGWLISLPSVAVLETSITAGWCLTFKWRGYCLFPWGATSHNKLTSSIWSTYKYVGRLYLAFRNRLSGVFEGSNKIGRATGWKIFWLEFNWLDWLALDWPEEALRSLSTYFIHNRVIII